ncbi:tyrosine-type recombinase/integrase [Aquisalimonas asiatica]|uniref:Site-specific recombinase XerD n=1 Tax=Aquisalimonas asiatica TaxID=406100 RepID=A0A1H8TNY3_9GAMM|nr:integrase family protein [Aquisalimonas asiatica]SEO92571.1 Site-specific recombinase XerD [Aquisalimonas asiatica]
MAEGSHLKLTKTSVESDKRVPESGTALYWDTELTGFGLRVTAAGTRSYIVQGRVKRKSRRITIGRHGAPIKDGTLTTEKARNRAKTALGKMADGIDPVEEQRHTELSGLTLRQAAEDYIANKRRKSDGKPLAERTKADIRRHLKVSFSDWADRPVNRITPDHVATRYKKLADRSQAQGNQAMRVLSGILNYVVRRHQGTVIAMNPATVIHDAGHYRGDVAGRKTRVPLDRIGAFYSALEVTRTDPAEFLGVRIKAAAASLLMLTGLRKADVLPRQWSEVDLDAGTIHVPDTKHRTPRTFPLASQAVTILEDVQKLGDGTDYVFPGKSKSGYISEIRDGLVRANEAAECQVSAHDLRRTFVDVCGPQAAAVDPLVVELLSNRKGEAFQALAVRMESYDTTDMTQYRDHAQRIADFIDRQRLAYEADNIVSMEGRG